MEQQQCYSCFMRHLAGSLNLTRDDLVRFVLGMQWREAIAMFDYRDHHSIDGSWWLPSDTDVSHIDLRPAVDIVLVALGVR